MAEHKYGKDISISYEEEWALIIDSKNPKQSNLWTTSGGVWKKVQSLDLTPSMYGTEDLFVYNNSSCYDFSIRSKSSHRKPKFKNERKLLLTIDGIHFATMDKLEFIESNIEPKRYDHQEFVEAINIKSGDISQKIEFLMLTEDSEGGYLKKIGKEDLPETPEWKGFIESLISGFETVYDQGITLLRKHAGNAFHSIRLELGLKESSRRNKKWTEFFCDASIELNEDADEDEHGIFNYELDCAFLRDTHYPSNWFVDKFLKSLRDNLGNPSQIIKLTDSSGATNFKIGDMARMAEGYWAITHSLLQAKRGKNSKFDIYVKLILELIEATHKIQAKQVYGVESKSKPRDNSHSSGSALEQRVANLEYKIQDLHGLIQMLMNKNQSN